VAGFSGQGLFCQSRNVAGKGLIHKTVISGCNNSKHFCKLSVFVEQQLSTF